MFPLFLWGYFWLILCIEYRTLKNAYPHGFSASAEVSILWSWVEAFIRRGFVFIFYFSLGFLFMPPVCFSQEWKVSLLGILRVFKLIFFPRCVLRERIGTRSLAMLNFARILYSFLTITFWSLWYETVCCSWPIFFFLLDSFCLAYWGKIYAHAIFFSFYPKYLLLELFY